MFVSTSFLPERIVCTVEKSVVPAFPRFYVSTFSAMSANGVGGGGAAFGVDVSATPSMYNMPLTTAVNVAILPIMAHKSSRYHTPPPALMPEDEQRMEVEQAGLLRQQLSHFGKLIKQLCSDIAVSETEHTGKVSALHERIAELEEQAKKAQGPQQLEQDSRVVALEASIATLEEQAKVKESKLASEHASEIVVFEKRIADVQKEADASKDKMQNEKAKHRSYRNQFKDADALCKKLQAENAVLLAAADV